MVAKSFGRDEKTSKNFRDDQNSHKTLYILDQIHQMYKIIFGHSDIDSHMFFDFNVLAKTRRNHNFNIRPKKTRTNYFNFSFFNRYITDWNSIPSNIMHASSLTSFKSYLLHHLCQF